MEQLPNELWLLIYRYLHDIDIFYSFNHLNHRFNNLIQSYNSHINLSDISLKVFQCFVNDILPSYNNNIHSILLKNIHQISFCHDYQILQLIENLKCLTIIIDNDKNHELAEFLSQNLLYLQQLTKLHIQGSFELPEIIANINTYASPSLIHLILLSSSNINYDRILINLPNLKSLKIHLIILHNLFELISNLHQLEELYISVLNWSLPVNLDNISLPSSLIKLHFEYGKLKSSLFKKYFQQLKDYLLQFQNQIQFLTLIITSREKDFSDYNQLELLQKSFSNLKSFEYLIQTTRIPSNHFDYIEQLDDQTYLVYTKKPKRPINFAHQLRNTFHYGDLFDIPLKELVHAEVLYITPITTSLPFNGSNVPHKLPNLYYLSYKTKTLFDKTPNEANFLSKLLTLSPNLKFLEFDVISPVDILYLFRHISYSSNRIESLIFKSVLSLDEEFFIDLAQILPDLKYLYLHSSDGKQINQSDFLIKIKESFKKLICISCCTISDIENLYPKDADYYVVSKKTNFRIFF